MQPDQTEEFKGYLSLVFTEMQNITEYNAKFLFKKFLENIQSKKLPFRDLDDLNLDEIFERHPSFKTALDTIVTFFKSIPLKDKTDIVTVAQAHFSTLEGSTMQLDETQIDDLRKVGPIKWLQAVLNDLAKGSGIGGTCEISSPEKDKVVVIVHGDLAVQYSARLFLTTFSDNLPVLSESSTAQATYSFPLIMVKALQRQHYKLKLFQALMSQHGYNVTTPGNKDCKTEFFVDNTAFADESDVQLRQQWGMSLIVAQALEKCEGRVVFPMTAQLRVKDAKQRDQFKVYFKNTNILNFDKTAPKQFIVANDGRETLCCNIAIQHAEILWDYFLRLDTIAKRGGRKAAELTNEEELSKAQRQIRANSLSSFKEKRPVASKLYNFFCSVISTQELPEIDYEREFEKNVNEFVWGPNAFHIMMDNSAEPFHLSTEVATLTQAMKIMRVATESERAGQVNFCQAFEQALTIPNDSPPPYVEEAPQYNPSTSRRSPSLAEYFLAMAQIICPDLLDGKTLITEERTGFLKGFAKSDLIQRCPTEVERFLTLHTPYYFVRKMADKLEAFLNSEDVTDEAIEKILTSYGVTDLDLYRVEGMSAYNIHHIKFSLLEIAFNACIKDKILLSINELKEGHPWRYDPHNKYNPLDKQGWITAFEWRINEIYGLGIQASQEHRQVGAESHARNDVTNTTLALGGVKASHSASSMFNQSKRKTGNDADADAETKVEKKDP